MAALYEVYTLCGLVPTQHSSNSRIQGVELYTDVDHVLVTDSLRTVTVYKVSDQKPLGSWTVKQGQNITCPAVFNTQTQEYVVITDNKVVRVWKDDDVNIDKAFKATVSADVHKVLSAPGFEPVVLFRGGAVRFLSSLLAAPQQPIEDVLSEEGDIRWSTIIKADQQLVVLFTTEERGDHFLYIQRFNPNTVVKHRFGTEPGPSAPLSFSAACRGNNIHLFCLYSNGSLYESVLRTLGTETEGVQALPRSLLLILPVGEGHQQSGAIVVLDEAHIAVVGFPHPSAGASKDYLCIWNTCFQTLQASKEIPGRIYSQLWCYGGKLYVPHGKTISVIPFECQKSTLAAAMGKLRQSSESESKSFALVSSWTTRLQNDVTKTPDNSRRMSTRHTVVSNLQIKTSAQTVDQLMECIKMGTVEDVQLAVGEFICRTSLTDLQLVAGRMAFELVSRSQTDGNFYPHNAFLQLLKTQYLCHSMCPELLPLALEKKDFSLCQIAFQLFSDIPEAITCAYLKSILSTPDSKVDTLNLDTDSVMFMKVLTQIRCPSEEGGQENGFSILALEDGGSDTPSKSHREPLTLDMSCPVGLNKGALLNEVLQTAYSDRLLLPHLKNLTVPHVTLFLQYLQFLYLKYSHEADKQNQALRFPSIAQIVDWVCLLLDAHFTVLVMAPEAKRLVSALHKFVRSQVKLYTELGKIEGSLQMLKKSKQSEEFPLYSIKVIEFF